MLKRFSILWIFPLRPSVMCIRLRRTAHKNRQQTFTLNRIRQRQTAFNEFLFSRFFPVIFSNLPFHVSFASTAERLWFALKYPSSSALLSFPSVAENRRWATDKQIKKITLVSSLGSAYSFAGTIIYRTVLNSSEVRPRQEDFVSLNRNGHVLSDWWSSKLCETK